MDVDPRIILAAERTLLAWIRTGVALVALGFVGARFGLIMRELSVAQAAAPPPTNAATSYLGATLVLAGGALTIWATVDHRRTVDRLERGEVLGRRNGPLYLGAATAAVAVALALMILTQT